MTRRYAPKDPVTSGSEGGDEFGGDKASRIAWERWKRGRQHLKDWSADSRENYDFLANRQWAEEDLATLKEQMRTPITFNRVQATVNAVSGYEINNRQEVSYLPRDEESQKTGEADVATAAAKFFRQESDAEDEESEQFRRLLSSGYGWIEHRMDYEENPEGMMKVETVDEREMVYDPSAVRPNLVDRGWDIRGRWWDKAKAKDKWPKADFDTVTTTYTEADLDEIPTVDRLLASFYASPSSSETANAHREQVYILEHTWREESPFYTVYNPTTGKEENVEPKIHAKFQEALKDRGFAPARSVKRTRRRYKRAFIHARDTLEEADAPCPEQFHYQCITGFRDRNKKTFFGLVTLMKDPQRWANKWLSQFLHLLNTNVKTGLWFEEGAFDNTAEVEGKIAKPGFVLKVNRGYLDKVKKEEPSAIPQDAFNLMQYAIGSIRDVTGANLEIMGQQQNDQPGVVEHARKQSAMAVLAPLFAAQRQYRKIAGRITLYFIKEYLSDGRLIRIVGQGNAKYIPLVKQAGNEYDIVVDESPSSPNQKEMVFGTLASILPSLMKEGIPLTPDLLDYIPGLPAQLVEKWKQVIAQKQAQPAQPDPKTALAQAKLQQDSQESQRQDQIDMQRLAFDKMKAQIDQLMAEREMRMREQELQFNRDKLASTERMHLGGLAHDTVTQHRDHAHESDEAGIDRAHAAEEAKQNRTLTLKTKGNGNGKANG